MLSVLYRCISLRVCVLNIRNGVGRERALRGGDIHPHLHIGAAIYNLSLFQVSACAQQYGALVYVVCVLNIRLSRACKHHEWFDIKDRVIFHKNYKDEGSYSILRWSNCRCVVQLHWYMCVNVCNAMCIVQLYW